MSAANNPEPEEVVGAPSGQPLRADPDIELSEKLYRQVEDAASELGIEAPPMP